MPNSLQQQFVRQPAGNGDIWEDFDPGSMDELAALMVEALTIPFPSDAVAPAASAVGTGATPGRSDQSQ